MLYFLYPQLRKLSGAERLILRLAAHVTALGKPVTLVTNYLDPSCRADLDPRVTLIETGRRVGFFHNHYLNAALEYVYSARLAHYIGKDAEAVTCFGPPSLPALFWSKQIAGAQAPHLYFCYEPPRFIYDDTNEIVARLGAIGFLARPIFSMYKGLDRAMARRADALLANSTFGAERLKAAYGLNAAVITHGVDLGQAPSDVVDALRLRYQLGGKCILLTVNFLHPRKRIDLFLRAIQIIRDHISNTAAFIVGSGPEEEHLHSLARELELEDAVIFTGFVPDGELAAYYALANLYVHTGKLESFGLSVLEASAAGVPVVSVDEGGPREIIVDGETGLLVEANADAIAQGVISLLEDNPRRAAMGEAGRRRVAQEFSWERGAATFLKVLDEARQ